MCVRTVTVIQVQAKMTSRCCGVRMCVRGSPEGLWVSETLSRYFLTTRRWEVAGLTCLSSNGPHTCMCVCVPCGRTPVQVNQLQPRWGTSVKSIVTSHLITHLCAHTHTHIYRDTHTHTYPFSSLHSFSRWPGAF